MPQTEIRFFRTGRGEVPSQAWLDELATRFPKARKKILAAILELAQKGIEVRRPTADYLRDGIYELRVRLSKINYRLLYGYSGKHIAVLTQGFTKEREVPDREIEYAFTAMKLVKENPTKYTAEFEM